MWNFLHFLLVVAILSFGLFMVVVILTEFSRIINGGCLHDFEVLETKNMGTIQWEEDTRTKKYGENRPAPMCTYMGGDKRKSVCISCGFVKDDIQAYREEYNRKSDERDRRQKIAKEIMRVKNESAAE